jgi:hypothetical protein
VFLAAFMRPQQAPPLGRRRPPEPAERRQQQLSLR